MKAISIQQPYAQLLCEGYKRIEFRTWSPPMKDLGERYLIHASQKYYLDDGLVPQTWWEAHYPFKGGVILGAATLQAIRYYSGYTDRTFERQCEENYVYPSKFNREDTVGWIFQDPVLLKDPLRYKGRLRLFDVPLEGTCWDDIVNTRTKLKDPSEIAGSP